MIERDAIAQEWPDRPPATWFPPAADGADVAVRLLGGFAVRIGTGVITDAAWRLRKAAHLVKLLALAPGLRLHREQLHEALWPHLDPQAAANNLRVTLHAARRSAGAAGDDGRLLHWQGEQLALAATGRVWVDATAFEQAVASASCSGDIAECRAALALYAGDLLPDDRYEEWLEARRARLRADYLALLSRIARADLARGDMPSAQAALRRALAADPALEEAHVALMRLHALAGRRAEALRQYQQLREALQRELDIEPDPRSTRLYEAILANRFPSADQEDAAPVAGAAGRDPRPAHVAGPATNLPAELTSFIGRDRELDDMRRLLSAARLVTLMGPGGSGKTRLALRAAAALLTEYRDGVWLARLEALRDPALVPQAVAEALDARPVAGQTPTECLIERLNGRRLLLALDNCEHLASACATLVARLLAECSGLTVLATSRVALGVAGERMFVVPPLSLPDDGAPAAAPDSDAVRLFVARAQLCRPDFRLTTTNRSAVAGICRRLDGLPLAIELAAARVRVRSVAQIAARLDGAHDALRDDGHGRPARQQTLRATFDWSYRLLSAAEQRLLTRLAVFAGGFSLEAAEAICGGADLPPNGVLDLLFQLVDWSLVLVEERDGTVRYRLLDTIRQYALERLAAAGEREALARRHLDWCVALAEEAEPRLFGPQQRAWQARLRHEHDNLRAALAWASAQGDAEPGRRLAGALHWFWWHHGYLAEGRALCEQLLPLAGGQPRTRALARTLSAAGLLAIWQADYAAGEAHYRAALAIWQGLDDQRGLSHAYLSLGVAAFNQGQDERAEALLNAGLALARQHREDAYAAIIIDGLGGLALKAGDLALATTRFEESLALAERAGDVSTVAHALANLGALWHARGDAERAVAHASRAVALARELDEQREVAAGLRVLAWVAQDGGDYPTAVAHFRACVAAAQAVNDTHAAVVDLAGLAAALHGSGQSERAARIWGATARLRTLHEIGDLYEMRSLTEALPPALRVALGPLAYAAAFGAGQALSLEQAVAESLDPALDQVDRAPH